MLYEVITKDCGAGRTSSAEVDRVGVKRTSALEQSFTASGFVGRAYLTACARCVGCFSAADRGMRAALIGASIARRQRVPAQNAHGLPPGRAARRVRAQFGARVKKTLQISQLSSHSQCFGSAGRFDLQ